MEEWKGVVIAESLDDPTIINKFSVDRALISKPFEWAPSKGASKITGRWHLYRVMCAEKNLAFFQAHIQTGWFTHFWNGENLVVLFSDARFDASFNDRSTWADAIAHGKSLGIPEHQLNFKDL